MAEADKQRYDPFRDEDLKEELAAFQPKNPSRLSPRPELHELRKIAAARGFEERPLVRAPDAKEPLKALQFRLPQSRVEQFHQLAFEGLWPDAWLEDGLVSQDVGSVRERDGATPSQRRVVKLKRIMPNSLARRNSKVIDIWRKPRRDPGKRRSEWNGLQRRCRTL